VPSTSLKLIIAIVEYLEHPRIVPSLFVLCPDAIESCSILIFLVIKSDLSLDFYYLALLGFLGTVTVIPFVFSLALLSLLR